MSSQTRILLVDDHDFLRRGLRAFFERQPGCVVVGEARNADEAYACMREAQADLVVMDLHLPGEDGLAATEKIKKSWSRTKVLVLSGKSTPAPVSGDVERAFLAGADGFVSKEDGDHCFGPAVIALMEGRNYLSPRPATELVRGLRNAAAKSEDDSPQLTERESEVLKRLAEGASYKDIAAELEVGVKSVDTYRTRLTKKLGVSTREDLVREAIRLGLIRAAGG